MWYCDSHRLLIVQIHIVMRMACWSCELILWWASPANRNRDRGRGRDRGRDQDGDGGGGGDGDRGRGRDREFFFVMFSITQWLSLRMKLKLQNQFSHVFHIFCMDSSAIGSEARQFQKNEMLANLKRGLRKSTSKLKNLDFYWKIALFAIKNKNSFSLLTFSSL